MIWTKAKKYDNIVTNYENLITAGVLSKGLKVFWQLRGKQVEILHGPAAVSEEPLPLSSLYLAATMDLCVWEGEQGVRIHESEDLHQMRVS